jgi:methylornithine synthase
MFEMKTGLSELNLEDIDRLLSDPEGFGRLFERLDPQVVAGLCERARVLREYHFGNKIFLYGFVYLSTHCRNRCRFCLYRSPNSGILRYRKSADEVIRIGENLAKSGAHLIDLTLGEDPFFECQGDDGSDCLVELIAAAHRHTQLLIMISPGVCSFERLAAFKAAGADWYACYQETHDRSLYETLRPVQSFDSRLQTKRDANAAGLLIEEGILCGVGETGAAIHQSMETMAALDADQVRVMGFVPQPQTPMADFSGPDPLRELAVIALLRLRFPDRLIPASLDVGGRAGLTARLNAGANVVTSLVPPGEGLAGVAQSTLDIASGSRTVQGIAPILAALGLRPASHEEYRSYLEERFAMKTKP